MKQLYLKPTTKFTALLIVFFLFGTKQNFAQILFVDHQAIGNNDGTSWTDAFTDLQTALGTATAGDSIWVAEGTYYPTSSTTQTIAFELVNGVKMFGGFDGTETDLSQRNFDINLTILSGDLNQDDGPDFANTSENAYTVIFSKNVMSTTHVDGFIISGGNANDPTASSLDKGKSGGGWYNDGVLAGNESSPTIRNCTFKDNQAASFGAGLYNNGSFNGKTNPLIDHCTFYNNHSTSDGAAIYNQGAFSNNPDAGANPTIQYCKIENNFAGLSGGGMFNNGASGQASPYIINTYFIKNHGFDSGVSTGSGGAIYNLGNTGKSSPTIINCVFQENEAYSGGAIYNLGENFGNSSPKIINCTFYSNKAIGVSGFGGAVYNNAHDADGKSSPSIVNSIFYGNLAQGSPSVFRNIYSDPKISYSLVDIADCASLDSGINSTLTCGTGVIFNGDPKFVDVANGDLRLANGSQAYNTGNNDSISITGITFDLDLAQRIQLGTTDMGAYESATILPIELLSFDAKLDKAKVALSWTTLTETNNDFFTIEHSPNGKDFEMVTQVKGAGNTAEARSYQSIDRHPYKGISYYRLKQTDFDGSFSYSNIIAVNIDLVQGRVNIFPNPTADVITISFSDFKEKEIQYEIYNLVGLKMMEGSIQVNANISVLDLNQTNSFEPGDYILRVFGTGSKDISYRFSKIGMK